MIDAMITCDHIHIFIRLDSYYHDMIMHMIMNLLLLLFVI
eukprot:COSAG05_NODE_49_length_24373_cov_16.162561_11_plen_40_part_00